MNSVATPLHTWRAVCRQQFREYRERGYSVQAFKTSSAYRQFIIELHAYWRAEHDKRSYHKRRVGTDQRGRPIWEDIPPEIVENSRQWRFLMSLLHAHGCHRNRKVPYSGYLFELHLEARRLIFCSKCAEQGRASPNCERCKQVRTNCTKEMLCPACYEGRGVMGACRGMGQCQSKCEKLLFRTKLHPPCGCPWEAM